MKMTLQGIMSLEGIKHRRFSSSHRRRQSLDGDQLGHHHVVGVKSPTQELSAKLETRIWPNCEEEEQQRRRQVRKSVWDCESSLYDSFELLAFSRQLNRAIAAESTPSALINSNHYVGGIRSLSMPHYVTSVSNECQYSPLNVDKEEINLQEEKLNSEVAQNEVEHQLDTRQILFFQKKKTNTRQILFFQKKKTNTRQILRTHNKRLGFPLCVQRLLTRLFHKKA